MRGRGRRKVRKCVMIQFVRHIDPAEYTWINLSSMAEIIDVMTALLSRSKVAARTSCVLSGGEQQCGWGVELRWPFLKLESHFLSIHIPTGDASVGRFTAPEYSIFKILEFSQSFLAMAMDIWCRRRAFFQQRIWLFSTLDLSCGFL